MKTALSTLALLALAAQTAFATPKVLQSVKLDLDHDGRADQAILLDAGNPTYNRLEIHLSRTRQVLRFEELVNKSLADQGLENDENVHYCGSILERGLKATKAGLEIKVVNGSMEACHRESAAITLVQYVRGELRVQAVEETWASYSAGDPSPSQQYMRNFSKKKVSLTIAEEHSGKTVSVAQKLSARCQAPTLQEFAKIGLPQCALAPDAALAKKACAKWGESEDDCPLNQ